MLTSERAHKWFRTSTGFNAYDRTQFKKRLDAQVKNAETVLLDSLAKAAAEAMDTVKRYATVGR
jgi:hypothetical protein